MPSYHINPKTHKPGRCFAKTPENCKFNANNDSSTPVQHYETKEEAQQASEHIMEKQFTKSFDIKKNNKGKQNSIIKESISTLGFTDRHGQLEEMLNNKKTYDQKNRMGIEFNDRPNGIKYIFYPNSETKKIDRIQILKNGSYDYSQEELTKIENDINNQLQQN